MGEELVKLEFIMIHKEEKKKGAGDIDQDDEGDDQESSEGAGGNGGAENQGGRNPMTGYDYLLKMPIHSLTAEKVAEILQQKEDKEHELNLLRAKPIKEIWREDLDALEEAIQAHNDEEQGKVEAEKKIIKEKKRTNKINKITKKTTKFPSKESWG